MQEGYVKRDKARNICGGTHGRDRWCVGGRGWGEEAYAMIADLPFEGLKGIHARAYAEVAKGILSSMAL